jgi:hypothetical protein
VFVIPTGQHHPLFLHAQALRHPCKSLAGISSGVILSPRTRICAQVAQRLVEENPHSVPLRHARHPSSAIFASSSSLPPFLGLSSLHFYLALQVEIGKGQGSRPSCHSHSLTSPPSLQVVELAPVVFDRGRDLYWPSLVLSKSNIPLEVLLQTD